MDRNQLDEAIWELRVPLLRLALSIVHQPQDAEDAVSQAVIIAYQKYGELRRNDALKPWLMKITARCCYEQLRKSRREAPHDDPSSLQSALLEPPRDSLYELLALLPSGVRQVLVLYYYESFSVTEIADTLGIPRPTVRMRMSRGRARLKQLLEQEELEGGECVEAHGI